ncbi:MAG: ABC transporter ATP-binding protein [Clostridia bacterium]
MEIILYAEGLFKSYNGNNVIKDISLSVSKGDFLSIIGNSGAGKSTLLYLLAGIEKPDRGKVLLEGKDLFSLNDTEIAAVRAKKTSFVFQFDNLFQDLTVLENVMLPGIISGRKRKEIKNNAELLLEYMHISRIRDSKPSEISGGEQQRTALARAMITNPEILFLDEPTGSLNSEAGNIIMDILKNLNKEHKVTIIQVTHNITNAQRGNRIILLKDGVIQEELTPELDINTKN